MSDEDTMIEELYCIKNSGNIMEEDFLFYLSSKYPSVRALAVIVVGLNLKKEFACKHIVKAIDSECDEEVVQSLVDSLVSLVHAGICDKKIVASKLKKLLVFGCWSDELKGGLYLGLLKLFKKITPREYAIAPDCLSEMSLDVDFIESIPLVNGDKGCES
ncbi:hypothetical protein [Vogesella alkaliphila]|nr:hypothetical protein [Vogesella alkaliphila]